MGLPHAIPRLWRNRRGKSPVAHRRRSKRNPFEYRNSLLVSSPHGTTPRLYYRFFHETPRFLLISLFLLIAYNQFIHPTCMFCVLAQLPRYSSGSAGGTTKVLNESAGSVGAIILLPIIRRTGISSQRSFCMTTTTLPSGLAKASWFS